MSMLSILQIQIKAPNMNRSNTVEFELHNLPNLYLVKFLRDEMHK